MKAVKFLFNADMRGGHDHLLAQAKKLNIDLGDLRLEEAVVFINRRQNKIKTFSYNGVISYVRFTEDSHRGIDLNALSEIARAFNKNGVLDYNKALKQSLITRLREKQTGTKQKIMDVLE